MKNKTKIVATLGPSSASAATMEKMIRAGVNVFRINFSHGDHDTHIKTIEQIKRLNHENNWNIATLADMQGPKLRVGKVEADQRLIPGETILFTSEDKLGTSKEVFMDYPGFANDVKPGEQILLDDGKLILKILETDGTSRVKAEVIQGGPLKSNKGVNLPNTKISLPCLTEKDLIDLDVALKAGAEWIGLSFVRNAADVIELKNLIREKGYESKVISKIEKPEAVEGIDDILTHSDAIMVARGDLGVEVPMQSVPLIQKRIVKKCLLYSKPVIIATQMMETMMDSLTPSRAEVNDVANSVLDGADAVMLSGETSVGSYPVEVVETMSKIISYIEERAIPSKRKNKPENLESSRFITDSICYNASKIADQISADAILTMTHSGYTAFKIASHRPKTNIAVFTANRSILNMLNLVWGVTGFYYNRFESTDKTFSDIKKIANQRGLISDDGFIIQIASVPIQEKGKTNMLKISTMK